MSLGLALFSTRTARASERVVPDESSVESWRVESESSWTETPLAPKTPSLTLASAT